jgi:ribosome biogenesis GTPase A
MAKRDRPTVKNDDQYEALRREGASKEKAARIANTPNAGKKGGRAEKYEESTRQELYQKAKKVGIEGRSKMSKSELINALRNH